jgi:multimeric flavodoxin WrbA
MNVMVLHGSARHGGDTDTLADHFLQGLEEAGANEVTHFRPIEMTIAHCRGAACLACAGCGGCVVQDDMQAVYPALRKADVVVIASPMFWGYMTSQLKTLFDRLEAVCTPEYFGGKEFVLLIGYRHFYGSMVEWLNRISKGYGSRAHAVLAQTYDPDTGTDLPVTKTPTKLEEARALGRTIGASRKAS